MLDNNSGFTEAFVILDSVNATIFYSTSCGIPWRRLLRRKHFICISICSFSIYAALPPISKKLQSYLSKQHKQQYPNHFCILNYL